MDGKTVALNHSAMETAPPPLDIAAMAWNWQAGRKFMLIEVDPPPFVIKADGSKSKILDGSSRLERLQGQSGDGRDRLLRASEPFHRHASIASIAKTQQVNLDLTTLFKDSDIAVDKGGAVGCMTRARRS